MLVGLAPAEYLRRRNLIGLQRDPKMGVGGGAFEVTSCSKESGQSL